MKGPKYTRPTAPVPQAFKEAPPEGWKEASPIDEMIRGKWWELYNDPGLNALEEQIAISNQNVLAAEANYRVARGTVRVARAALFPTVGTLPSITVSGRGRTGAATSSSGSLSGGGSGVNTNYSLPFEAFWQVDVWGAIRRSVAANTDLAQAAAAQLENVRLLFQSELAIDYFQLHASMGSSPCSSAPSRPTASI